jgi:hypothetical protein
LISESRQVTGGRSVVDLGIYAPAGQLLSDVVATRQTNGKKVVDTGTTYALYKSFDRGPKPDAVALGKCLAPAVPGVEVGEFGS